MIYNDGSTSTLYYYVLNAQGDVIALLNSAGALVASYNYGAWGNYSVHDDKGAKITKASFIGHINPLRYRGYYYDRETRLYYLQSRYYDFANCRFINADTFATTDANGFLSANMFAYCENNPIGNSDPDGYFAAALAGGGHLSGILVAGGANFWNPVGWIVVGITVAVAVGAGFYYYSEHSKRNGSDKRTKDKHQKGNARRQRDQGGEKKKQKSGWKSRR